MLHDAKTQKLLDDCRRLQIGYQALDKYVKGVHTLQAKLASQQDDLIRKARDARRQADDNSSIHDWRFRWCSLTPNEIWEANLLWTDLRDGTSGAPKRLQLVSEHVRALILEALETAMRSGDTGSSLFATLASK